MKKISCESFIYIQLQLIFNLSKTEINQKMKNNNSEKLQNLQLEKQIPCRDMDNNNNKNQKTSKQIEEEQELCKPIKILKKQFQCKLENDEFDQQIDPQMNVARIRNNQIQEKKYFGLNVQDLQNNFLHQILRTLVMCFRFVTGYIMSDGNTIQGNAQQLSIKVLKALKMENVSLQKDRKITDFIQIRNKFLGHNNNFHLNFLELAQKFFQQQNFKNQFDREFYDIIVGIMVSNIPFESITFDYDQFSDLFDRELILKQNQRFQDVIDEDMVHLVNFNSAFANSKGVFINFDTTSFPQDSQKEDYQNFCFESPNKELNNRNEFQQMAIYVPYKNMIKKIIKYQSESGKQFDNIDVYITLAILEKQYLFPEFLGFPMHDYELQNYHGSIIKIQKSYIRNFDPRYHGNYKPYIDNLGIKQNDYREFQEPQILAIKYNKLR
ncbi:hypothetical protein TTHERM_00888000 (macronuclear) [Tetrahymena thermophila SB210]|uniref:Uncharacterized protein n=1 Tax=Tetrahymena thermophila (strain SB210) TaxID=312017 RepID=Q23UA0_TETTS|nr:hypothetical protein TTHERM_00888000 [Tetrahymena thermophila SB210]EAS00044.2 hypothetical protein TTHERM_00888000 [Tetrahymena thermophila SB210]|eukprot:XP_001020289.2 hypothetical protein TTHERM_00888000 [Tetrahymena thermophila SB210]